MLAVDNSPSPINNHSGYGISQTIQTPGRLSDSDSRRGTGREVVESVLTERLPGVSSSNFESLPSMPGLVAFSDAYDSISFFPFELKIQDVELAPGVVLRRRDPLVLRASQTEPDGCLSAEVPGLNTPVAGYGLDEMRDALCDLIAVLWEEYALEDSANLTARAKELKEHLIQNYAVVE